MVDLPTFENVQRNGFSLFSCFFHSNNNNKTYNKMDIEYGSSSLFLALLQLGLILIKINYYLFGVFSFGFLESYVVLKVKELLGSPFELLNSISIGFNCVLRQVPHVTQLVLVIQFPLF